MSSFVFELESLTVLLLLLNLLHLHDILVPLSEVRLVEGRLAVWSDYFAVQFEFNLIGFSEVKPPAGWVAVEAEQVCFAVNLRNLALR